MEIPIQHHVERTIGWKNALDGFPENVRSPIDRMWDGHGFLPADSVRQILESLSVEIGTLMMQLLPVAQQYAVVPVSHYLVGAVAAGMPEPGSGGCCLYLGANFEFVNA